MQSQAVEVAQEAMEKYTIEKEIAQYIKKEVCASRIAWVRSYMLLQC